MGRSLPGVGLLAAVLCAAPAWAETPQPQPQPQSRPDPAAHDLAGLQTQIAAERQAVAEQRRVLDAQEQRLNALEDSLLDKMRAAGLSAPQTGEGGPAPGAGSGGQAPPAESVASVGAKPEEAKRPPDVAVLADQGGILTRPGRLILEPNLEYARVDRNRFIFRGIEIPQSVLVGVFDINESRQDILTAAAVARFGLTSRLEVGLRVPWVYRNDTAVLVPLVQNPPQSGAGTINTSAHDSGFGDIEMQARYQVTDGTGGWPYLIAGLQVIAPTGTSPFNLPRDPLGNATKAATGAGFWGIAPTLTILMPSDPATLFGVIGYTFNFGRDVDTRISDAQIDRVEPGGAPTATLGIGIGLNERTSVSFAYAHSWQFATKSIIRPISVQNGIETIGDPITSRTRDLQLGRFLFGISYRATARTTINWTVEVGTTDDAADLRTVLRVPFSIN